MPMLFFQLKNVKMPTIVGILTFMSRKNSCSTELSMEKVLLPWGLVADGNPGNDAVIFQCIQNYSVYE